MGACFSTKKSSIVTPVKNALIIDNEPFESCKVKEIDNLQLKGKDNKNENENGIVGDIPINKDLIKEEEKINSKKPGSQASKTVRFTNLIKKDDDLKSIVENFEGFLNSNEIDHDEKLKKSLFVLKELTEPREDSFDTEESIKEFKAAFIGVVERHFRKIIEPYNEARKGYKPLIKLLQVFDLMLENFESDKLKLHRDGLIDKMNSLLKDNRFGSPDWKYSRKLYEKSEALKLDKDILKEELFQKFMERMENAKKALVWKEGRISVKYAEQIIENLYSLKNKNRDMFVECLMMGRFDKKEHISKFNTESKEFEKSGSLIIGDQGGVYFLMNSINPGSVEEKIILEAGVSKEFLNDKRNIDQKVILGKGAFGKVRFGLSVFGDIRVDFGQLICVKKSICIGERRGQTNITLGDITESVFEDFFSKKINESIHAPKVLDMAIVSNKYNKDKHKKGYTLMEIIPENTAEKVFQNGLYQKWEFQKPFILEILQTTKNLLVNEKIFNSDLKPQNTLFDPFSRKMTIIDLGSSIFIDKNNDIKNFDASNGGFGVSKPYCPPEIRDESQIKCLNLLSSASYLCGVTIAQVTSEIPEDKKLKYNVDNWALGKQTDLDEAQRNSLVEVLKGLLEKEPTKRLDISDAQNRIGSIGSNDYIKKAMYEQYIYKLRDFIKKDPSALNLNADIIETKNKGIIEQYLVESDPRRFRRQKSKIMKDGLDAFFKMKGKNNVFLLLGDAGSGKSLALQLKFLEEVEIWEYGKAALPIFFNMADEVDLERVIRRINANIGCNLKLETENEEIHLFIDSYDEGAGSLETVRNTVTSQEQTSKHTIIQEYIEKLKNWTVKRILISCRTDFVQKAGDDDLSDFKLNNNDDDNSNNLVVRYIAPISYGADEGLIKKKFHQLVSEWLIRENKKGNVDDILKKIRKAGLEEKMKTGLMFNMIMNMLLTNSLIENNRLRGFDIYNGTIKEEFNQNWLRVISSHQTKGKEQIKLIKEEIANFSLDLKDDKINNQEDREIVLIWEGLERIGERIAADMTKSNKNRLSFSDVEASFNKSKNESLINEDIRSEWKTLYQMFRVMGLKLENRNLTSSRDIIRNNNQGLFMGFRHETYKNYYLLRGLKRLVPLSITNESKLDTVNEYDSNIISAVLDEQGTIQNFELLKFFGEEIRFRDKNLKDGLRKVLKDEQEKCRKLNASAGKTKPDQSELKINNRRAAVVMSLLVAADYSFSGEDLSDLDLSGANMRGGMFFGSKFERTNLSLANLRHTNLNAAKFNKSILKNLDLGVWPDLIGHKKSVNSVVFSADGKRIVSGSCDFSIKIWDSTTGGCKLTLEGHKDSVNSVYIRADGRRIASGSKDKTVRIWDANSGYCLHTLEGHKNFVNSVCFSPDGKKLASGSKDNNIKIWDSNNGECLITVEGHTNPINTVCFSPDGLKFVSGSQDKKLKIWETTNWELIKTLEGHTNSVKCASFSPDGMRIASSSSDTMIRVWDSLTGQCIQTLEGHKNVVPSVCFSNDGKRLASGSRDKTLKIWDSVSGETLQTLEGHKDSLISVCFNVDGRKLATASSDKTVKIWDGVIGECVQTLEGHKSIVNCVCFSTDGKRFASGSFDRIVKIWDSASGECQRTFEGHKNSVKSVAFSIDGKKVASGSLDKTVKIWDINSGECLHTLEGHKDFVKSVVFSADGKKLTSGSFDNMVKVWDCNTGECLQTHEGDEVPSKTISFSADGKFRVEASNNTVKLWQAIPNWILKMSLKSTEETFSCEGSVFEHCSIDDKSERDLLLKTVISQRGGTIKGTDIYIKYLEHNII